MVVVYAHGYLIYGWQTSNAFEWSLVVINGQYQPIVVHKEFQSIIIINMGS